MELLSSAQRTNFTCRVSCDDKKLFILMKAACGEYNVKI